MTGDHVHEWIDERTFADDPRNGLPVVCGICRTHAVLPIEGAEPLELFGGRLPDAR